MLHPYAYALRLPFSTWPRHPAVDLTDDVPTMSSSATT